MPDGKPEEVILRRRTREYPTEWTWYPADEEQGNARALQEKQCERSPETSTPKVNHVPKTKVLTAH